MRNFYFKLLMGILFFLITAGAKAQITVTGCTGPGNGTYATLGAAITAIGTAQPAANIVITVSASTTEGTGTISIGAGTWSSMTISPSGGAWTISASTTAGLPMIDLNGADNVTIDGLNTGGNALTITNTTASATSGTSTIRFQSDATNNTITNCSIRGSATMAAGTNGGNIWFGSAAVSTGNDGNIISNCDIGPAGANLPSKCIYFSGSSNTDPGTANSGITINNNNIFDFFHNTALSAGIDLNSGTVGTVISNNRIYQTASRTISNLTTQTGIRISNTSGGGYQITGNTIGFANSSGTGNYTLLLSPATGGRFCGISLSVSATPVTSVQGNTIAGFSLSGPAGNTGITSPFIGILVTAGFATIGDITGNTIGSQSATGSISLSSSSADNSEMTGIYNSSANNWIVQNNTIGGITGSNSSNTQVSVFGIRMSSTSTLSSIISGNTIGGSIANSIQSATTSTTSKVNGITISTSGPLSLSNNIVRNLRAAGGTGTGTSASVIGISISGSASGLSVSQNTISNLSNIHATNATIVTGIHVSAGTSNIVESNLIHSISSSTTSTTAELNGIYVGGGSTTYRNNMIAIGAGMNRAIGTGSTTGGIIGINESLGTDNFYHNSVYIGGSPTAGAGPSYAFKSTQTAVTRNFRNNIFFNARSNSGATGKNYVVTVGGTTANPAGLTINNNVYFANGTGAVFGYFNSLDVASLPAWKTAVGQDASSFNSNPQYLDPANALPDLHINAALSTLVESNGVDMGVTLDYDAQTRSGLTPVDIGADAGNFTGSDQIAPDISAITPTGDLCNLASFTVTAILYDVDGVDNSSFKPRIYFRKNAGSYFSSAGTLSAGTVNNGTWTFTITYATVGGVVAADVIDYFIVAQDVSATPHVGGSPSSGLVLTDVFTVTTPPTTPLTYTIVNTLSGTYTVGSGGNYATLTAAVASYNTSCLGGAVIFELLDAGYTTPAETFPITINVNSYASATNTLTIRPATGVTATISGASATSLIKLNGADYVIIDGSNNGSSSKDLTILNTSVAVNTAAIWLASLGTGAGATNNTIKNCNIKAGNIGSAANTFGIYAGGAAISTSGTGDDNDGLTVHNNTISKTYYGIYVQAASTGVNNNLTITNNTIGSVTATDYVTFRGLLVSQADNALIRQNTVFNMISAEAVIIRAMDLGTAVTNTEISRNTINNIQNTTTTGFRSGQGITVNTANPANMTIANNVIYGLKGHGHTTMTNNVLGIAILGGGGYAIYFNSVNISDNMTTSTSIDNHACLYIAASVTNLNLRNNVFSMTATAGHASGKTYGIYCLSANTAFTTINYNDYYAPGTLNRFAGFIGSDRTTLANIQAGFGQNVNSLVADPQFNSNTVLVPQTGSPLLGAGDNSTGISIDILGVSRGNPPTIGAFETPIDNAAPGITYTPFGNTCITGDRILTATITDASGVPTSGTLQPRIYYKKGIGGTWFSSQGTLTAGSATNGTWSFTIVAADMGGLVIGDAIYYYVIAQDVASPVNIASNPAAGLVAVDVNTVTTPPTAPASYLVFQLSGTYTVGVGGNYTTLTAAAAAYNSNCLGGPVIFSLTDANYASETFPITFNLNADASALKTLTIQPAVGVATTIIGSNTTAIINLNGSKYITLNGINSGGSTLLLRNTAQGTVIRFINDAVYNTISNVTVESGNNSLFNIGTIFFGASNGVLGNSYNLISSCTIRDRSDASGVPDWSIYSESANSVYNVANTIQNCNIFNWTSAGIGVDNFPGTGNGDNNWTISSNSFYQTASRSTISLTGIYIISGNGHSIINNSIGGTAPGAGGTRMLTSTFTGIALSVTNTTATSVQGNTIKNISSSFTDTWLTSAGISVSGGTVNIGTITGNIIGSPVVGEGFEVNTNCYGIRTTGSSTVNISNNVINNMTTGATVAAGTSMYGISVSGTGSTNTILSNTIINFTNGSIPNTTANTETIGIQVSSSGIQTIRGNVVHDIGNTSTTVPTSNRNRCFGLIISGTAAGSVVEQNRIYNIFGSSSGTGVNADEITLIQSQSLSSATYSNNMLSASDLSGSSDRVYYGFIDLSAAPAVNNYYHNTVNIYGTATGANKSYAINRNATTTVTLKSNIFNNARTGGTGFHVAIANTNASATGWPATASDNNDLYSANPATIAQWLGTGAANNRSLAGWQASQGAGTPGSGGDANSISVLPVFTSSTDLHLNYGVTPTPLESGGVLTAITVDIDNDTRPGPSGSVNGGATAPDIGADEFDGVPQDIFPPVITYTALPGTCLTTDRTLTATITDVSGVPVTGPFQPRIYYKKNAGSYFSSQGVKIAGTGTSGTWTFTIVNADMGGVSGTDVISYFVIAQDIASPVNIISNPSAGLVATDVNTVITPPTTPGIYFITLLAGTYTVGAGGNYTTLTAAVAAYNSYCLGSAVVFSLIDASYPGETFPITINANPDANSTNTLTIKATVQGTTITGSSASGLIVLNGADYVIIDGSVSATANTICPPSAASRDLTITQTHTSTSSAVIWLQSSGANGATNITIKNINLVGNSNTTTLFGVGSGSSTISGNSSGTGNNNNSFINNNISKTQVGIYSQGAGTGNKNTGTVINQNLVNTASPNHVQSGGIAVGFENNIAISGNNIDNIETASSGAFGISAGFGAGGISGFPSGLNEVTNALITHNVIGKIFSTSTIGYSSFGIGIPAISSGINTVANNTVSGVLCYAIGSQISAGIYVGGGTGTSRIYFNTVSMTGFRSSNGAGGSTASFALAIYGTTPAVDIKNNILFNSQTSGNNNTPGNSYAIGLNYSGTIGNYANLSSNNNIFFVSGEQAVLARIGGLGSGTSFGKEFSTLQAWTAETGRDGNSVSGDPLFNSTTNLQTQPGSPAIGAGSTGTGITTDFACIARNGATPTIGAYELAADLSAPEITYTPLVNTLCLTDGSLSPVIITDIGSGVNITAGTKPRLYFKKISNANTFNDNTNSTDGWKYTEATNSSSPFSFITNYSLVNGGVTSGDIIQYFVVAQDLAATPHTAINRGIFNAAPSGVSLTAGAFPLTGTINQYNIMSGGLAADVTIGAAGTYPTLTGTGGLFDAINNSGLLNNVTARILDGAITETGTVSLNAIGFGCSGSFILTIKPNTGVTTVLSGTNATSLVNLNGADNVIFDGSNNGSSSKDMTIRNSSTTGATISFINDATGNTIKNSIIEGASTTTTTGVILFSTSAGTLGNSNNTIMNNDIRDRTDALAAFANAVYSEGSASAPNASNIISANHIFNFTASGINLSGTGIGNSWQMTNNSFYNNLAIPPSMEQTGILVTRGSSHVITGNFIGGQSANAGGSPWINSGAITFSGISLVSVGISGVVSVQNNTIQNISLTTTTLLGTFNGIIITGESTVNVGTTTGNTIGHASAVNSIQNSGNGDCFGIYSINTRAINISNNTIANFTGTSTTNPPRYMGIFHNSQEIFPITISNNNIHSLTCASSRSSDGLLGIYCISGGTGTVINGNTIYNLRKTNPTASTDITGLFVNVGPFAEGTISKNSVYGLENPSSGSTCFIIGIEIFGGTWTVANNLVSITNGSNTNSPFIIGLYDLNPFSVGSKSWNYNSIFIGGNASSGIRPSFAYYRSSAFFNSILRNNILYNARTGGTGSHYAIGTEANPPASGWSSDYNDLYAANPNTVGLWGTNFSRSFAQWQTSSAGDANSVSVLPVFVSQTDLHLSNAAGVNCKLDGTATPISVVVDYDNDARDAVNPDMGADEFIYVPSSTLAAITGGGQVCSNEIVRGTGTIFKDLSCNAITKLLPNGGNPLSGMVNSCVTIDATVQSYNGHAYVQRHYDITPAVNQTTATARVTLYVLQTEFDNYNTNNGSDPDLPTGPGDAIGIANLRVTKYSGNGTAPGNYVPGVPTTINPAEADIIWNGNYWEISFNVTGFSGFYIYGGVGSPLPVTLLNFSGYKDGSRNQLRWTTASEQNNKGFELQRSNEGINYSALGFVNSQAMGGNSTIELHYSYTDNNVTGNKQYYRLRQEDLDGRSKFSNIVLIKGDKPVTLAIDGLFPNPASTVVNVLIAASNKDKVTLQLLDATGRIVIRQNMIVETGTNTVPVDISRLTSGTFLVKLVCNSNCESVVGKFIKD